MFGSHLSIAGGMYHALDVAATQKMDCVQVFTKNQRQWKTKPLQEEDVAIWLGDWAWWLGFGGCGVVAGVRCFQTAHTKRLQHATQTCTKTRQ